MLRGIIRGHIVSTKKQQSLVGSKFMEVEIVKYGSNDFEMLLAHDFSILPDANGFVRIV